MEIVHPHVQPNGALVRSCPLSRSVTSCESASNTPPPTAGYPSSRPRTSPSTQAGTGGARRGGHDTGPIAQSSGGAHEGRCRQGDRGRRTARRPGTRSARQAHGRRARDPRRGRRRRRRRDPRCGLCRCRRDDRHDRRAVRGSRTSILRVQKPSAAEVGRLRIRPGRRSGCSQPLIDPKLDGDPRRRRASRAISLDAIPRTLSRAQTMDALSSQANVGGYKAVLIAANAYGRYFPLLTTAAGTAKPAQRADPRDRRGRPPGHRHGPAPRRRRHGLRRPPRDRASRPSRLGAKFVKLKTPIDATGAGGYARELTAEERAAQQAELNEVHRQHGRGHHHGPGPGPQAAGARDRGGRRAMKPGSVIVDMAASALGGNCELSQGRRDDRSPTTASRSSPRTTCRRRCRPAPSAFYARNISALLLQHRQGRRAEPRLRGRGHRRPRSSPTTARSCSEAVQEAARPGRRCRMNGEA